MDLQSYGPFRAQNLTSTSVQAVWDLDRALANWIMAVCDCTALWYWMMTSATELGQQKLTTQAQFQCLKILNMFFTISARHTIIYHECIV